VQPQSATNLSWQTASGLFTAKAGFPWRLAALLALLLWAPVDAWSADEPLTSIAAIRRLPREVAAKALAVELKGVCLWCDITGHFVISDGKESIWVSALYGANHGFYPRIADSRSIKPGAWLEVNGVTNEGGYAPIIFPVAIQQDGVIPIPKPKRLSMDRMLSGSEDGQWVEIDGVIQEIHPPDQDDPHVIIGMKSGGQYVWLYLDPKFPLNADQLIDASVQVRGICAPDQNLRSEVVGLKFYLPDANAIQVLTPPLLDPFQAPRVSLKRLLPFSPEAKPYNRKVTTGVVTFAVPGEYFFLQDGQTSVRVSSNSREVKVNDRVEIAGFVDNSGLFACMKNVLVRIVGTAPVAAPQRINSKAILKLNLYQGIPGEVPLDFDCRIVTLQGKLLRVDWRKNAVPDLVKIESEGETFSAELPNRQTLSPAVARAWEPGAKVEVTGICELEFGNRIESREYYYPVGFHLLLASPRELKVLNPPPWWTPGRLAMALGGTLFAIVILLLWTAVLRRVVAKQTRIISKKIRSEATQEERERIARDLHDSIEQQLAGVSLHLYGAQTLIASDPSAATNSLDLARQMLKHTQKETRTSIRDLRSDDLVRQGLVVTLRGLAESFRGADRPLIEVQIPDDLDGLSPDSEYQLLRLAQEALNNAIKHAEAKRITIGLHARPEGICLTVVDDGCGFRPEAIDVGNPSHFGMLGMQERAAKLRAKLDIVSEHGKGCSITVSVPYESPSGRSLAASNPSFAKEGHR